MVPVASPGGTVGLVILILAAGLLPVLFIIGTGHLTSLALQTGDLGRLVPDLIWVGAAFLLPQSLAPVQQAVGQVIGRDLDLYVRDRVMAAVSRPVGLAELEGPAVQDDIKIAQGVSVWAAQPYRAVVGFAALATARLTAIGALVIIGSFRWWLAVVIAIVQLASLREKHRSLSNLTTVLTGQAVDLRRADYISELALEPEPAKEARIFGWRPWAVARYQGYWDAAMAPVWRARRRGSVRLNGAMLMAAGSSLLGLVLVVHAAQAGALPLGRLVTLAQAVLQAGMIGFVLGNPEIDLEQGTAAIPAVLDLETRLPPAPAPPRPSWRLLPDRVHELRFDDVSFCYPTSPRPVLDHLDLVIPAGRSTAIVGPNGAGKTTVVKLLGRLYEPSAGRITVDGLDLADIDPVAWRRELAAIFQDFVRYPLSAADNVGFGAPERGGDERALERAARRSGLAQLLSGWPNGWATLLSRDYDGGIDLSGGQWQRVALARALFAVEAGARLLILDEPTAQLDVRGEAEVYDQVLELTRGLTTVVISHRFSTVRRAEHIVVLDEGRVAEVGSHDQLMALDGTYAAMFRLQAARYLEDDRAQP